ncbi:unnamed protein product [Lactuca saligna]|uniref:Heat shock protein 70 n=1 Tax=Lactuca saligna TaxID=75948 RepID=A0AA35Y8P1_LACSI|nr:unnamed protein product [Lactuca saligna]
MVGKKAIGIDLGTTYYCVAVWQHDQVEIIPNDQGNRTMPSCVSFNEVRRLVGEAAKIKMFVNPTNTVYGLYFIVHCYRQFEFIKVSLFVIDYYILGFSNAKRLIGRRFYDAKIQEDMKLWPFKVIKGTNNIPKIVLEYNGEMKEFFAEEISSMVLVKLKEVAEAYLGETVKDAVITVPAYFNDSQRQATKDVGHVAGLNVLQIVNEPTAVAIAYGLHLKTDISHGTNVLIFDLGGGTFDVSLVNINNNGTITVKAVAGDTHLGGQDFDNAMVEHFVMQFNRRHKTDMSRDIKAMGRLRVAYEKAKRSLSSTSSTTDAPIEIDDLHQGIDFSMRITRAKFEHLNGDLFGKCIQLVGKCLGDAEMNKKNVNEVVLVGGSTRIPKIQQLLKDFFNGKELSKKIPANEAVAYGAAVLAAKLSGESNQKVKNLVLLDVVPLSLGVSIHDDSLSVIIKRNSPIPVKQERIYVTSVDNQSAITFDVYQGEKSRAIDNDWLGKFQVAVPVALKGMSRVNVVFEINVNGILNCSAEELTTGLKKKIRISDDKQRLSKEEIEKMLKDAEKYKLDDEEYKKKLFAHNLLEEYIYDVNAKIKSIGSIDNTKIPKEELVKMENVIRSASQILDLSKLADVDKYEKTLNELENVCVPIIAQLMK